MHYLHSLVQFGLPVLALASPLQLTLTLSEGDEKTKAPVHATWEKENRQLLIPLTDKARTGLIDVPTEEGLIHALGPRFANAFYENDNETTKDIFGCLSCGTTVIRSVPCIYSAINANSPSSILNCVSKSDLCDCLGCLPNPIVSYVTQEICEASSVIDTLSDDDRYSPYADFATLSYSSAGVAAFRGDLYNYQVEQLKAINEVTPDNVGKKGDVHATDCSIGGQCGDCCCLGACVFGACVGACF